MVHSATVALNIQNLLDPLPKRDGDGPRLEWIAKGTTLSNEFPPNSGQILLVHQMGGQSTAAASNLNCQILSMSIGVTVRIFADSLTMPNARTRAMLLFLARGVVTGGSRQNMCLVMSVESLSHCVGDNATSLSDTDSAVAIPLLWAVCIKGARMCIIC